MNFFKQYLTPSFFLGLAAAALVAAANAVSVFNGNFETVTFSTFAVVVGTAVARAVGIYIASKVD